MKIRLRLFIYVKRGALGGIKFFKIFEILSECCGLALQLCLHCLSLEMNPRVNLGWRPARHGSAGPSCSDSGVGETLKVKSCAVVVKLIYSNMYLDSVSKVI